MKHLEIVEIKNEYIERLRKTFSHVMKNTNEYSKHNRKYIGVVFEIRNFTYYAPFSSPKIYDYDSNNNPKQNTYFVIRMANSNNGKKELIGKILMNCMIPVPRKYVKRINIKYIKDKKYKELLATELEWVTRNPNQILQMAVQTYNAKNNNIVLPFKKIEKFVKKHY